MPSQLLITDGFYHVFSKSIAEFRIFNADPDFLRMQEQFKYYQVKHPMMRFAKHFSKSLDYQKSFNSEGEQNIKEKLVDIVAYCIMPTHFHLVIKQLQEDGTSIFMSNILNSYTRYFNIKYKRKGPLWESRFKRVVVVSDEQLLHLTRYVHLNPATAYLTNKPEEWAYSSYNEYLLEAPDKDRICHYKGVLNITPKFYKRFVEGNIENQRHLASIKSLLLDQ